MSEDNSKDEEKKVEETQASAESTAVEKKRMKPHKQSLPQIKLLRKKRKQLLIYLVPTLNKLKFEKRRVVKIFRLEFVS